MNSLKETKVACTGDHSQYILMPYVLNAQGELDALEEVLDTHKEDMA